MSSQKSPPTVYIIAGPNGAGKTTFATQFLPKFVDCREFLNADLIAAGLAPFAPETQNIPAARLLLTRMKELAAAKETFGFETTLAGRSYARILSKMKADGYRLELFFLWLSDADIAVRSSGPKNRVRWALYFRARYPTKVYGGISESIRSVSVAYRFLVHL